MTQKELAEMYGIKPHKTGLKDKKKAKDIVCKILKCHKCGGTMKWITDTNQCVCPTCSYSIVENENKQSLCVTKSISNKSRKFLEDNYSSVLRLIKKEETNDCQ